jgi:hypothetical protein
VYNLNSFYTHFNFIIGEIQMAKNKTLEFIILTKLKKIIQDTREPQNATEAETQMAAMNAWTAVEMGIMTLEQALEHAVQGGQQLGPQQNPPTGCSPSYY